MKLVHQHLIVRAEVTKPLTSVEDGVKWMDELVTKIGMKKVSGPHVAYVDKEGNKGLTGAVLIETSSITLHIWDETTPGLVQLDVYTCSTLDLDVVFDHLKIMEPTKTEYKFIDREMGLEVKKSFDYKEILTWTARVFNVIQRLIGNKRNRRGKNETVAKK